MSGDGRGSQDGPRSGQAIPAADVLRNRLVDEGLSSGAATEAVRRLLRAARESGDPGTPGAGFFVPGRIEVLGKHTDYAGGRSLVTALEAGISAVVFAHDEPWIEVVDTDPGRRARFSLESQPGESEVRDGASGAEDQGSSDPSREGWTRYPQTYLARIQADLSTLGVRMDGGARLAWSSSLPRAAGMSSSSALLVTLHLALASQYGWAQSHPYRELLPDRLTLASYLAAVEAGRPFGELTGGEALEGVGTDGGSQDHTAILCGRAGEVAQFAFRPARFEGAVRLPSGWTFAVASSGVAAPKADTARERYNRLAAQIAAIMELWWSAHGRSEVGKGGDRTGDGDGADDGVQAPHGGVEHPGAILELGPGALVRLGDILRGSSQPEFSTEELLGRARQFMDEAGLHVPSALRALEGGDLAAFGRSVEASHRAAVRALGNDTPETEALTLGARELGAVAASPFGAGFGGSVWALVREDGSAEFLDRWRRSYLAAFPEREEASAFLRSRAGPPALRVF